MERRRAPRIRSYETVQLTVLGDAGYTAPAHAIDLSATGMRLVTHRPIPINVPVKVLGFDWLALGDVRYSIPERDHFAVGLQIEHVLVSLAELARLNHNLADDDSLSPLQKPKQLLA